MPIGAVAQQQPARHLFGPPRLGHLGHKYSSGTQLKVYEAEGDYFYVRVVKENLVGYIAAKFVDKAGIVPGENATPTPKAISGTIPGTVSASKVALRSIPSTEGNTPVSEAVKGDAVYIYFKTGDFYYIQVASTGLKCYAAAKFITASTAVPTGTSKSLPEKSSGIHDKTFLAISLSLVPLQKN